MKQELAVELRCLQMSSLDAVHWYKFRPIFTVQLFFFPKIHLSVCGRFCSRCSRSDLGLSDGFRSSLSLSNVLLALFLSACLSLSLPLRTVRPSHLSWLRSALLQMHKLLESCRNWVEVFTFPERLFFLIILTTLESMRELYMCWEADFFRNTVYWTVQKNSNLPFQNCLRPA